LLQQPLLAKGVILLSTIPIALAANVTRITVTGILYDQVGSGVAEFVFHDLAGWLMMPLALGMLWLEVHLLKVVLLEPEPEDLPMLVLGEHVAPPVRVQTEHAAEAVRI